MRANGEGTGTSVWPTAMAAIARHRTRRLVTVTDHAYQA